MSAARLLWNPASGRGRGARVHERLVAAFAKQGITDVRGTAFAGDEARLVHEAIADGIETIVVAGGDGTWSKCAVALARAGSPARMAFVAAGTGNDFAKNFRAPFRDFDAMARLVAQGGEERRADLGRVGEHLFTNVAGFGFDVVVSQATARYPRLRGPAVYVAGALSELFRYDGLDVRISGVEGEDPARTRRRLMLVFANGKEFGGAFPIAPSARIDDGLIHAIVCNESSRVARVPLLISALRGTHLRHPMVRHATGDRFEVEFAARPWFELDGDLHEATTTRLEVGVLPGALRVLDAPRAH